MPAFGLNPPEVGREIPSRNRSCAPLASTFYLAIAALAILFVVRALFRRLRPLPGPRSGSEISEKRAESQDSLAFAGRHRQRALGADGKPGPRRQAPQTGRTRGFVPLSGVPSQFRPLRPLRVMDDDQGDAGEEHYPWSALALSRGVSGSSGSPPRDPPGSGPNSPAAQGGWGNGDGQRPHSRASLASCNSGHAVATEGSPPRDHIGCPTGGLCDIDGHGPGVGRLAGDAEMAPLATTSGHRSRDPLQRGAELRIPRHFPRPPPPPPLTPPRLSDPVFPFEHRRPSNAVSIPPALDMSFIHQPNPDYGAGYSTSADAASSTPRSAAPLPRRRSYTRSVPIGMGPPPTASAANPATSAPASSSTEPIPIPGSAAASSSPASGFSPSSYPPSAPFLPPPPPTAPPDYVFVGGPGGPGVMLPQHEMIDLRGEIVSVVDDAGHGWTRHTRVYGGGTCLACVAAAARDGELAGGFYGDTVPLEDRR